MEVVEIVATRDDDEAKDVDKSAKEGCEDDDEVGIDEDGVRGRVSCT